MASLLAFLFFEFQRRQLDRRRRCRGFHRVAQIIERRVGVEFRGDSDVGVAEQVAVSSLEEFELYSGPEQQAQARRPGNFLSRLPNPSQSIQSALFEVRD